MGTAKGGQHLLHELVGEEHWRALQDREQRRSHTPRVREWILIFCALLLRCKRLLLHIHHAAAVVNTLPVPICRSRQIKMRLKTRQGC